MKPLNKAQRSIYAIFEDIALNPNRRQTFTSIAEFAPEAPGRKKKSFQRLH